MRIPHLSFACLAICSSFGSAVFAADDPEPDFSKFPAATETSPDVVAATVNGEPIKLGAVSEAVKGVLQGRSANPDTMPMLQAEVLSQLIDRALIVQLAKKSGKKLSDDQVNQAIEQVKKQAEEKKIDFAKSLANRGLTEETFREQLTEEMQFASFLQKAVTDSVMRKYFEANKTDFDGTEVRVSHILLRPDGVGSKDETERLKKIAGKLREQIESGKRTFEDSAKQLSAGPSRRKGGDLGFIPRQGLMLEPFSAAAFHLKKGQISEPVVTPYGVHLIKVTEVKPGRKLMSEVKEQLKAPVAQAVFMKLADAEREKAKIEFTGNCPHFKPGTKELADE